MNLGGREFEDLVNTGVLTDGVYPYAAFGRCLHKLVFRVWLKLMITVLVIELCCSYGAYGLDMLRQKLPQLATQTAAVAYGSRAVTAYARPSLYGLVTAWVILVAVYMATAVRRWAFYERSVFRNDRVSETLRRRFIARTRIKRRIKDAGAHAGRTAEALASRAALKCIKRMRVEVHTRNNLMTGELERRFIVAIPSADDELAADKLASLLKPFGAALTRMSNGAAVFGDGTLQQDYTSTQFVAVQSQESAKSALQRALASIPRLKHEQQPAAPADDDKLPDEQCETAFPLEFIPNMSDKLEKVTAISTKWALDAGETLDVLLTTAEQRAERLSMTVTAMSALYTYALPFSLDTQDMQHTADWLDKTFKTQGSTVAVRSGNLRIVLPLPKTARGFIYTRKLFKDAFGSPVEV